MKEVEIGNRRYYAKLRVYNRFGGFDIEDYRMDSRFDLVGKMDHAGVFRK